jgi:hypothetical protein
MRAWPWLLLLTACEVVPVVDAGDVPDAAVVLDDAGTIDAGPARSGGTGKLTCLRTGQVNTTVGAKPYCVGSVAGVEFKVIEPDDVASPEPMRLAVYVHGDGARAYVNDTALRIQAPWTTSHHVLYVAALAPNGCAWWVKPGVDACDAGASLGDRDTAGLNAAALEAVVTAVRAGWDVLDAPMLFGGASGGSIFLSASYLPRYGSARPGVWALSCGGEVPWTSFSWDGGSADQSRLSFTWGDQDFLAPDITQAVGWFSDAGFPVETKLVPGAQHCAFDHLGRTTEIWGAP